MGNELKQGSACSCNHLIEGRPPAKRMPYSKTYRTGRDFSQCQNQWKIDCLSGMLHIFDVAFIYSKGQPNFLSPLSIINQALPPTMV